MSSTPPAAHTTAFNTNRAKALAGIGLGLLLAACSTGRPGLRPDEVPAREFAARGYASVEQGAVTTGAQTWVVGGQSIRVVVAQPGHAGTSALVIYLPGLGETSVAGEHWRSAWASAGYTVMSVQPLAEDAAAWTSDLALDGDFKTLGRQRYSGAAMNQRVQMLADIVHEAQRRSRSGEPVWQRVDWDRVAIAGFDLGAYTAMVVAGERVQDVAPATASFNVRAAIALSPYASFAAGALDTRYLGIHGPVLSVTGDADRDSLGLVNAPLLRTAPFNQMTGPDKYLLSLHGLPHSALGGSELSNHRADPDTPAAEESRRSSASTDGDPPRRSSGKRRGGGGGGGETNSARPSFEGNEPGRVTSAALSANAVLSGVIAAQGVSTAFLDAYLKQDPMAREWLAARAPAWLAGAGAELRRN